MSKKRLIITILFFVLIIALVVGVSYLVSLGLKKTSRNRSLANPVVIDCEQLACIEQIILM